jgi:hypothetical protein
MISSLQPETYGRRVGGEGVTSDHGDIDMGSWEVWEIRLYIGKKV